MLYKSLIKPFLFTLEAEKAHDFAISTSSLASNSKLINGLTKLFYNTSNTGLEKELFGLKFPNPIGLAAGFDKNGVTPLAMQALGFGFVEVGSITAKSSAGNPKPRAFRLPKDRSLINRMGLNNEGAEAVIARLKELELSIPLGINIAKTNDASIHGEDAIEDYLFSYELANSVADYITINISCPNTGEGKTFEDPEALDALLKGLGIDKSSRVPTLVKFSVDTNESTLTELVNICEKHGISGYVATNTSSIRKNLLTNESQLQKIGNGGLSGHSIFHQSTLVLKWLRNILGDTKPIIAVGGIDSIETAKAKLDAGADLLQVYTGMVFKGPGLVKEIKEGLKLSL